MQERADELDLYSSSTTVFTSIDLKRCHSGKGSISLQGGN